MNRMAIRPARAGFALRQLLMVQNPSAPRCNARSVGSVAEVSFWKSLVPKPLRSPGRSGLRRAQPKVQKEWNPATFFIFIFLLIGSMSIQMISLRKDFAAFSRQADVRIGLLREVVEKLQRGEDVDVEGVLGTGDAEKEQLWEQVLRELEREEPAKQQRRKQAQPAPAPVAEEPAPAPTSEQPAPPARAPLQSTLASKGFY